jgi:hypothetical protein
MGIRRHMPQFFVPTGLIVEAVDAIQAQAFAYGLLTDAIAAEREFSDDTFCAEPCACESTCERAVPLDFWTYDYDDPEHPVTLLEKFAEAIG